MWMNQTGFLYSLAARLSAEGLETISISFCVPPDRFEVFLTLTYENPQGGYRYLYLQLPQHIPVYFVKRIADDLRRDLESLRTEEDGIIEGTPT